MKLNGSKIFVESLIKEGVDTIFGYPGGAVLNLYDALYDSNLRHILTRHEQGAIHAADGYARATGKPGVCIATSGPGATNLVTGIATAHMDSIPIVAFTGQAATPFIGKDSFQEADITGITLPITKHNYLVKDVRELPRVIKEAFYIATTGRPGPVLVDLPKDVTITETEYEYPESVNLPGYKPTYSGHLRQISDAADFINEAKKPVLYIGGGVIISGASEEVFALATRANIPVTTTLMGIGGFPSTHKLSLGMLGMHGTQYANYAVTECDLLLAVGVRFDDRVTGKIEEFAPNAKIIHIDIDPAEIGKNVKVDLPIVGDVKNVLRVLVPKVKQVERKEWIDRITEMKETCPLKYTEETGVIKPQQVIEAIYEVTEGDAIITTEVGQHQMWAAQYYKYKEPRSFISSGGLGTMGYGFPAAIGAKIGRPDKTVFDIAGDGSIQMNIQELATAVQYGVAVKIAILNNGYLGMVRQWQELFYKERYSETFIGAHNPDFVRLAEAYGARGFRVEKPEQIMPVLKEAMSINNVPVLIDFCVSCGENVYPMVPVNGALNRMILGGD